MSQTADYLDCPECLSTDTRPAPIRPYDKSEKAIPVLRCDECGTLFNDDLEEIEQGKVK